MVCVYSCTMEYEAWMNKDVFDLSNIFYSLRQEHRKNNNINKDSAFANATKLNVASFYLFSY